MARPSLKKREYTFYFPSDEDKARWKRLAHPLTLNRWIYLTVEKAIAGADESTPRAPSHDINALRQEVAALRQENADLATKLERSQQQPINDSSSSLLELIKLFISGGTWSSSEILGALQATVDKDPLRAKLTNKALEQLVDFDMVEKTRMGWKMNTKYYNQWRQHKK